MPSPPLVSAIITTFNRRLFLREALGSVLRQDYTRMEVIVVDDGSTDGSYEDVRGLPVRYLWQPNRGISAARNRGIRVSRGELIAFLDADDLWMPQKISAQVDEMEKCGAVLSYTDEIWLRDGRRINQKRRHGKHSGHIFAYCLPLCIISPSSALIARHVFDALGPFDERLPVCEDYDMWLRVTARYPVLFIPRPLITKRAGHGDQLSTRYEGMDRFRIRSLLKVIAECGLSPGQEEAARRELQKKCAIYGSGALKRGRKEEAEYYLGLSGGSGSP